MQAQPTRGTALLGLALLLSCAGCESTGAATGPGPADASAGIEARASGRDDARFAKPGFHTEVVDGRLWVLREGSEDVEQFLKTGEPAKSVTKLGVGPDGMTVRSSDFETIRAYIDAR